MRWAAASLLALLAAGCGGSEPIAVQLTVDGVEAEGEGMLVTAAEAGGGDVAPRAGEYTLYAEVPLPMGRLAVLELGFDRGELARARYRELANSRVVFAGEATDLAGRAPRVGPVPAAGHFAFVVAGAAGRRKVRGSILPATGEAVEVPAQSGPYVRGTTSSGCDGAVYVPPPVVDDPYVAPEPPPRTPPPPPPTEPDPPNEGPDPWTADPPPPPASGGCEGDAYDDDEDEVYDSMSSSGGGCEGDAYEDDSMSSSGGGCEGDAYEDDSMSSSGGGCEGDSAYAEDENAEGCEGAAAAAVLPFTPRLLASLARFSWPFALCGAFNRGARRRSRRP